MPKLYPTPWKTRRHPLQLKASSLWNWTHMEPCFPLMKTILLGELQVPHHSRGVHKGSTSARAATRCCAQHDAGDACLMNLTSCHRTPHIPFHLLIYLLLSPAPLIRLVMPERYRGMWKIRMTAMSWATKVLALKGNGPTHWQADLRGWLTNTLGRKATGGPRVCERPWMPSHTSISFISI